MNAKTFLDVQREYSRYRDAGGEMDLAGYAKAADADEGTNIRQAAYTTPWYKYANAAVDRAFEATQLPEVTRGVGKGLGELIDTSAGTNVAPVLEQIGRDVPRMVTEGALTIPMAATGAGAPAAVGVWANRARKIMQYLKPLRPYGQAAGYGGAGLSGYAQTDSPLGAAIGAGQMYAANKLMLPAAYGGMDLGGKAADAVTNWISRSAPDVTATSRAIAQTMGVPVLETMGQVARRVPNVVAGATDVGVATGLNEATRQAMMSVGPNAVGFDPRSAEVREARNPFTAENVAAAAAGATFFTPQIIAGMLHPRATVPKQVTQLEAVIDAERGGPIRGTAPVDPLVTILQNSLDDMRTAKAAGEAERLPELRQRVMDTYKQIMEGRRPGLNEMRRGQVENLMGSEVMMNRISSMTDLERLSEMVLGEIDRLNEGRVSYLDERAKREEVLNQNDRHAVEAHKKWVEENERAFPQGARERTVVQQLWQTKDERGNVLQPLTPEWLESQWQATFDQSGNAKFALDVVAQKVANYYTASMDEALARAKSARKADTSTDIPPPTKSNKLDEEFVDALTKLAEFEPEAAHAIALRTAELAEHGNYGPGGFTQRPTDQPIRHGVRMVDGRPKWALTDWRTAVVQAVASLNPQNRSVLLPVGVKEGRGKRVMQRMPLETLFKRNEQGKFVWYPSESHVPVGEPGGARTVTQQVEGKAIKVIPEQSFEEVGSTKRDLESLGALDEEEFKAVLAQEGGVGLGAVEGSDAERLGMVEKPPTEFDIPEETVRAAEAETGSMLQKYHKAICKGLETLDDNQLWALVQDLFPTNNAANAAAKKARFRGAFLAALENMKAGDAPMSEAGKAFLAAEIASGKVPKKGNEKQQLANFVRKYFGESVPVRGASGRLPYDLERLALVARRLMDPRAVEVARRVTGTQFSVLDNGYTEFSTAQTKHLIPNSFTGDFVKDSMALFRDNVTKNLSRLGYSGGTRDFLAEITMALSLKTRGSELVLGLLDPDTNTVNLRGILNPTMGPDGKPFMSLDVDSPFKTGVPYLQLLAHELVHLDDFTRLGLIKGPDAFTRERKEKYDNFYRLANALSVDEKQGMLEIIHEWVPKAVGSRPTIRRRVFDELHPKTSLGDRIPYGTDEAIEFIAEFATQTTLMLGFDTPAGRNAAKEVLDKLPQEAREYARDSFRTLGDILEVMRESVKNREGRTATGKRDVVTPGTDPFILTEGFGSLLETARQMSALRFADRELAAAQIAIASLDAGGMAKPPAGVAASLVQEQTQQLKKVFENVNTVPSAVEAMQIVEEVFSPRAFDKSRRPSVFARWLYPFSNLMTSLERQGVPLAREVFDTVGALESGVSRIYSSLMRGFLRQNADGSFRLDQDSALIQALAQNRTGRWREAYNQISAWQQWNTPGNPQPMFVIDPQGRIVVNSQVEGAEARWNTIKTNLSQEDQQLAMGWSVAMDKAHQLAAEHVIASVNESNKNTVATYLLTANKKMTVEQAYANASQIIDGYLRGDVNVAASLLAPEQVGHIQKLLVGQRTEKAPNGDGLLPKFLEVSAKLRARPGFRSESLPFDWIVKYKDGEQVLYASREHESQALALAERLRSQGKQVIGEVVNKNDLDVIFDFEHPDAILAKAAETESFIYNRFVEEIRASHGNELADALKAGYEPLGQAMKEVQTRGIGKVLAERKGLVDRREFDYIDGPMMYFSRLANTIAIRAMEQRVRLLMHDPRARLLPSFQRLVKEHVGEMLQPTSKVGREMKAAVTTYFLGGNLASAAVNGTQSITSLLPWLIAGIDQRYESKTGVVKGWKDLGVAMANAMKFSTSNEWQQVASRARGRPPQIWTEEEALAAMYRRHVEGGGVAHTVVDDLMYGHDRKLMINTKFGRGDYGPVPLSKMVLDKMYVGSQMMMSLYKVVEHFNARTAFLAGIKQGFELGLRGDELYYYGTRMQSLATFGGGRANAPGIAGREWAKRGQMGARSAVGLATALQQYSYGMVAMYAQLGKDALGKSPALNALQRRQAQKAFGTLLMTQTAVAGVLGMPFAGAALTLMEKVFGIPAQQAIREGLASLAGEDPEDSGAGATIAETAMNGWLSQATGLDLASRFGISNILGTSAYRGFNVADLAGPAGSIIANGAEALNLFGQDKPLEAATALVPNAFKTVMEMSNMKAKYGNYGIRDKAGNLLYVPTDEQAVAYGFGIRPRELSQKLQMRNLMLRSDERAVGQHQDKVISAAQALIGGDGSRANILANDIVAQDQTFDRKEILRNVVDHAVAMVSERDALSTGSRWNEGQRLSIAKTFGLDVNPRQSEVKIQDIRMEMARRLNAPDIAPTRESYQQAMLIDQLVQPTPQNPQGMPRSQAVRLAAFLVGGP